MVKQIRTKAGELVKYDDYVASLRNQYDTLIAAEEKDLDAITKVQDEFFALLLWRGDEEEISSEDIERVVKYSRENPQRQAAAGDFVDFVKRKEQQLQQQKENPKVPPYLKEIWPYFYAALKTKEEKDLMLGLISSDYAEKSINSRAAIIAEMCGKVLDIRDKDLVPKSEDEARTFIQNNWALLHMGKDILDLLEKIQCEYDIVDKSDFQKRDDPDAKYRKYTFDETKDPDRKFPDKEPFLAALKHKQKLISNLLIYEEKWKAEAQPGEMDFSDWEIVQNDVQPDKSFDKKGVYRHNFVQNARGKISAVAEASSLELDEFLEIVKNKMVNDMVSKLMSENKDYENGIPADVDIDAIIADYEKKITEEELYDAAEKYADKILIEEKNASSIYEEKENSGYDYRDIHEINKVNQKMDEFIRGDRDTIGDRYMGYSTGDKTFVFQNTLEVLTSSDSLTDLDKLNSAEVIGKFVDLYLKNIDRVYPSEQSLKSFDKLSRKLTEIKDLAKTMRSATEGKEIVKGLDESIEKTKQCIDASKTRMDQVEKERARAEELRKQLEAKKAEEERILNEFAEKRAKLSEAFVNSDKEIEKEYKHAGIIVDELKEEAAEDAQRAMYAGGNQSKNYDVTIAQRWGYDPCRNVDDDLNVSEEEKAIREQERINKMHWRAISNDVETAQISLLGLPAKEFPGTASPLENKLTFMTRFLSDPDFKKNKDVAEFIDKQHILFEQVRAGALHKDAKSVELLMRMYSEAQSSIAWLSVYNHKNPAMAASLHEASNTVNTKLFAPLTAKDSRIQPLYQKCVKLIGQNADDPFSKEFFKSVKLMEQSIKLNRIQEKGVIAKSKIVNNSIYTPTEKTEIYADYMAMKLLSKIVANDKRHSLAVGELQSPSLALLDHEDFSKRFVDGIKKTKSFEELMKMDPVEFRKCILVNEEGLKELTDSMVRETVSTFKKDEFDQAIAEARLTEEPKAKKPVKEKENKEALQIFNF